MAHVHTIPLHLGDLITDTMHLTPAELGGYVRLLAVHYRMGREGLPDDDAQLRRITGLDNRTWQTSRLTLLGYFEMSGDGRWVHRRVQTTLDEIAQKREQNRDKALKRWKAADASALPKHSPGNADAMQSISHKPKASIQKSKSGHSYSAEFEEVWSLYPRRDSSKADAFKAYQQAIKEGADHGRIIAGVGELSAHVQREAVATRYIPHASTWVNGKRWESDYRDAGRNLAPAPAAGGSPGPRPRSRWIAEGDRLAAKYAAEAERERQAEAGPGPQ